MKPGTDGPCLEKIVARSSVLPASSVLPSFFCQCLFDRAGDGVDRKVFTGLNARDHLTLPVHDELGKVPGDLAGELGIG